jgi:peptidyl-prolyl cis-trans isomerase D
MAKASQTDDDTPRKKRKGAGLMVWVLVAMLVAGLSGFGVQSFSGGTTAIGKVGDTEITGNEYARELRAQVNALSEQFGTPLTLSDARSLGVDGQVLQILVNRAALDNEAARVGVSVGDPIVATELGKIAAFKGLDGGFDREAYGQMLRQNGTNEAEFENGLRRDVSRALLVGAVAGGTVAPAPLTDTILAWAGEKRGLTLLAFDETALAAPLAPPTEAELKAHYDANLAAYTRPEAKRIQYAALLPETMAATMTVPEDEVKKAYDARLADFVIPEKRLVERLVFPTEADAAAAKAQHDQGIAFEELVKARGLTLEDIDLGDVTKADLAEAGEAVFALEGPGVVGPLPSSLGPALYRMNAVLAAQETTFEAARPQLLLTLQTEAAAKAIATKVDAIDDALAGGASLDDMAAEFGMTLGSTDYAAGADDNDAITTYAAFREAAGKLAEGDFPEAILLDDGGLVSLQLVETVPPTPVPLEKIIDKVTADTSAAALAKALTAAALAAKTAVEGGAKLEDQGKVETIAPLDRQASLSTAPASVLKAAFDMAPGELRLIDEAGYIGLVRLDSVLPVAPADEEAKALRDAIVSNAQKAISEDINTLFTTSVSQSAGITMDQAVITAINTQMGN